MSQDICHFAVRPRLMGVTQARWYNKLMPPATSLQTDLDRVTQPLVNTLGQNLYSLILYGSAVRGDMVANVSDIHLLIVLERSTPAAHRAIATVAEHSRRIDPFILGRHGMDVANRLRVFGRCLGIHKRHGQDTPVR